MKVLACLSTWTILMVYFHPPSRTLLYQNGPFFPIGLVTKDQKLVIILTEDNTGDEMTDLPSFSGSREKQRNALIGSSF